VGYYSGRRFGADPRSWQDKSVPSSLASHLADVYLEELDKVLAEGDVAPAPVVDLVYPHILLLARTRTQAVHTRLMTVVFTPLITALSPRVVEVVERPAKRLRGPVPVPAPVVADDDDDEDALFAAIARTAAVEGKQATKAQAKTALLQAMFKEAAQEGAVESNRRKIYTVVREQGDDDEDDE
jgi:ribosomal RNA-processing protein 1